MTRSTGGRPYPVEVQNDIFEHVNKHVIWDQISAGVVFYWNFQEKSSSVRVLRTENQFHSYSDQPYLSIKISQDREFDFKIYNGILNEIMDCFRNENYKK